MDAVVNTRVEKLKKYEISVQPLIVAVGDSWTNITDFYTCIDTIKYKHDHLIQALDSLFCAFFFYHLQFPPESKTICSVISDALYGIEQPKNSGAVNEVLIDLKNHRQQKEQDASAQNRDNSSNSSDDEDRPRSAQCTEVKKKEI